MILIDQAITIDYGPLAGLIGTWRGDKGIDIAPEPDGKEINPFYETITFSAVGDVTNAETQVLVVIHYRQIVQRKSNDKVFHDETGYWYWDDQAGVIIQSLTIPRAVSLLAGGNYDGSVNDDGSVTLEVNASEADQDWHIIQSPFMQKNARTTKFQHLININTNSLKYSETTIVDIYGKEFVHTDQNELIRE